MLDRPSALDSRAVNNEIERRNDVVDMSPSEVTRS